MSCVKLLICIFLASWLFFAAVLGAEIEEKVAAATWTEDPIELDGRLDEAGWTRAIPIADFIQAMPREGEPATDPTIVRILFDQENLYFGVYCYQDPKKIVVSSLNRDFTTTDNDVFGVALDTWHDHRNGFVFFIHPGASKEDIQVSNDGLEFSREWDGIWEVATQVREDGWTAEIVIPLKTLGYSGQSDAIMGVNFKRRVRHKNEDSHWSHIPPRFRLSRMSLGGVLQGIGGVEAGHNLRVKPFVTTDLTRREVGPLEEDSLDAEVGLDVKYRLSRGLTLDLTYNTDFSQVEVDTQQINLTRFSLFFPEKRDFFLENATLFRMGDVPNERGPGTRSEESQLFYSRRIGLSSNGQVLPLLGGARLSGQMDNFSIGLLNIHQEETVESSSNNFTVARLRRNILARSQIGAIFISREGGNPGDYNRTYGLDANLLFQQKFTINTFIAATQTPGLEGENVQTKISGKWDDDYWYTQGLFADIGTNFNPEVGFVPRRGVRNYQYNLGLKPRTEGDQYIREFHPNFNIKYFTDRQNRTLTKSGHYAFEIFFRDGGKFGLSYNTNFERLLLPFRIHPNVTISPGDFFFNDWSLAYASDGSKLFYGSLQLFGGDFYDGRKTGAEMKGGLAVRPRIVTEVTYEYNSVNVNAGQFQADLYSLRFNYSLSPTMFFDTFLQYNSTTGKVLANIRFNWEHHPLSHLSLVFTEDRLTGSGTDLFRAIIFKYTHLLQF
jgi:hypothetical protein